MSTCLEPNAVANGDRLDAREAAEFLGLRMSTLYRAVRENRVPHYRIGRIVRFSKATLEQFISNSGTARAA